jgi:hypothetical protein
VTPELSLAFAIQSSPGVYALLLGSGVSRAARIPTGWEVVLDLVRKLAAAQGADCEPDPAAWFQSQYGEQPGYSRLLDALAKTPAERSQILRSYFEQSEEEGRDGAKSPTKAHRAIARLVASGHIRVILTTNFDRLMERALEEVGVAPTVISTPDQVEGAVPLAHMRCCVIKLHGDYLDTRILNTPEELAHYAPQVDKLLDQVFDEYGLVACGWSADWDEALRRAIERAPSRRFSTFFAARGELGERARALLTLRAGRHVAISDADAFFEVVEQRIRAIEQFSQPHPLSVKAAVAACKRFLASPDTSRIQLADLIGDESRRVCKELQQDRLFNTTEAANTETVTARVRLYEGICKTLCAIGFQVGRWGDREAVNQLAAAQRRLYGTKNNQGLTLLLAYQGYPVTLLTYAALLGASVQGRCDAVASLLTNELVLEHRQPVLAVDVAPPFCLLSDNPQSWAQLLEGQVRRHAPLNDWLAEYFWGEFGDEFDSRVDYDQRFDWVEVVLAIANHKLCPPVFNSEFHPPGRFGYRGQSRERVLQGWKSSLATEQEQSPYVKAGVFGGNAAEVEQAIAAFEAWAAQLNGRWW